MLQVAGGWMLHPDVDDVALGHKTILAADGMESVYGGTDSLVSQTNSGVPSYGSECHDTCRPK